MEHENYRLERCGLEIVSLRSGFVIGNPDNSAVRVFDGMFLMVSIIRSYSTDFDKSPDAFSINILGYTITYMRAGVVISIKVDNDLKNCSTVGESHE
jgi:hypothetical protein